MRNTGQSTGQRWDKWQEQQKGYKKNTEKKISGIPGTMAAINAIILVKKQPDEKKSESIETQVTLIKEFIQKHNENPDREYEIAVYGHIF